MPTNKIVKVLFTALFVFLFLPFYNNVAAQDYNWAYTGHRPHHTQPVAIRKDNDNNLYLAIYTDSLTVPVFTSLEKRTAAQNILWQKQIDGDAAITDIEINSLDHLIVTGYFKADIIIDGNVLSGLPNVYSGFLFEMDGNGSVIWVKVLNPLNSMFKPFDLFIAANDVLYLTAQNLGTGGLCSFHKLDEFGNFLKSEYTTSFDNRNFSYIIADSAGNVYLSGSGGDLAVYDSIHANPAFSYQNFLIKYDSNFKAQWYVSKNYITFDDNNKLCTDGKHLYWAFDEYTGSQDTVKILKINYNGEVLSSVNAPVENAFLPSIDYSVDRAGNGVILEEAFVRMYIYRYDSSFNITWQDTLMTSTSGNPIHNSLVCYDSSFYMQGIYLTPSLELNNISLTNPNTGISYPSDLFVYKWEYLNVVPLSLLDFSGNLRDKIITLHWITANESNVDKFIVEKSEDGIHFKQLGSVGAKNKDHNNYEFNDQLNNVSDEFIYYRLKQTDNDGHFEFSKVISFKLAAITLTRLFPNPVTTLLNIQLHSTTGNDVKIAVYNPGGQLAIEKVFKANVGTNFFHLDARELAAGNYVIMIDGDIKENFIFSVK